jgi:carbon monoxide dehydrogenase subunit G
VTVRIECAITLGADPDTVWRHLDDVSTHTTWMRDAAEITFHSEQHSGVGTEFLVLTKIGPLRNRDLVHVTRWEPGAFLGIEHHGSVTGSGDFQLEADGSGTRFTWVEILTFPWWMGGVIAERIAKPVLAHVWRGNLRRLRAIVGGATTA